MLKMNIQIGPTKVKLKQKMFQKAESFVRKIEPIFINDLWGLTVENFKTVKNCDVTFKRYAWICLYI